MKCMKCAKQSKIPFLVLILKLSMGFGVLSSCSNQLGEVGESKLWLESSNPMDEISGKYLFLESFQDAEGNVMHYKPYPYKVDVVKSSSDDAVNEYSISNPESDCNLTSTTFRNSSGIIKLVGAYTTLIGCSVSYDLSNYFSFSDDFVVSVAADKLHYREVNTGRRGVFQIYSRKEDLPSYDEPPIQR